MVQAGAKIKEVPIQFQPRKVGESKIISNEMIETLRVIFLLQARNPQIQQFIKFGTVGFIGYLVQATTLQILTMLHMPEVIIWGGSAEISIISNFTWNNLWTFKHQQIKGLTKILTKFIHFNLTSAGAILIQILAGTILVNLFGAQYRQLYLPLIIALLVVPYNYIIYTKLIWKK
jgi:dolichol-phosphate mannosyltransferase